MSRVYRSKLYYVNSALFTITHWREGKISYFHKTTMFALYLRYVSLLDPCRLSITVLMFRTQPHSNTSKIPQQNIREYQGINEVIRVYCHVARLITARAGSWPKLCSAKFEVKSLSLNMYESCQQDGNRSLIYSEILYWRNSLLPFLCDVMYN